MVMLVAELVPASFTLCKTWFNYKIKLEKIIILGGLSVTESFPGSENCKAETNALMPEVRSFRTLQCVCAGKPPTRLYIDGSVLLAPVNAVHQLGQYNPTFRREVFVHNILLKLFGTGHEQEEAVLICVSSS